VGVAAGETVELSFNAASVTAAKLTTVELTFEDVSGQKYATEAGWDRRRGAYRDLRISERKGLRLERIPSPMLWRRFHAQIAAKAPKLRRSHSSR
jgi:hypothetical protein